MCSSHSLYLAAAAASVLTASASHSVSAGEMVRAYVLVDAKPSQKQAAMQSLDGLGNCPSLTHSFMGDEIVAIFIAMAGNSSTRRSPTMWPRARRWSASRSSR